MSTRGVAISCGGDTEEHIHVHLVSWQKLCRPKDCEGLGLRMAKHMNSTFLKKIGWNLSDKKDDLGVRTLRTKYHCGNDLLPRMSIDCPWVKPLEGSLFSLG